MTKVKNQRIGNVSGKNKPYREYWTQIKDEKYESVKVFEDRMKRSTKNYAPD